jgi:MYXO-CTERM domain-containing protein
MPSPSHKRSLPPTCAPILGFLLALAGVAPAAHAIPIEEVTRVTLHPSDPQAMVIAYTSGNGGLIYTQDGGQNWKLMCSSMMERGKNLDYSPIAMAGDGTSLVGTSDGIRQSAGGCGWSLAEGVDRLVTDFALHPKDPSIIFAVTGKGGDGANNGIFQRDASGKFTLFGAKTDAWIERIRVTTRADGGLRFYQSAQRSMPEAAGGAGSAGAAGEAGASGDAGAPAAGADLGGSYVLRVSDDDGMTWMEHPIAVDSGKAKLEAVDPTNPDRIVISIDREREADSVLVSKDKGATFEEYAMVTQIAGVTMADDGRIWIADHGDFSNLMMPRGLWAAPNLDAKPEVLTSDLGIGCLKYQPKTDTLFACGRRGFPEFGTIDQKTGAFHKTFEFVAVHDFLSCPGVDAPSVCETQLCGAYCGRQHYARAPLCNVYSTQDCGPVAAQSDRDTGWDTSGSSGAGGSGGSSAPRAGTGGGPAMKPPLPEPTGATKSGGCAVDADAGAGIGTIWIAGLLALVGGAMWRRARRRV